jgi:hypothetical protein
MSEGSTNYNYLELITSLVDNQHLNPSEREAVLKLIKSDESYRKRFESEMLLKNQLSAKLTSKDVPHNTRLKVINAIDNLITESTAEKQTVPVELTAQQEITFPDHIWNFLTSSVRLGKTVIPVYSIGAAAIVLIIIAAVIFRNNSTSVLNPYISAGSEKNIMVQAVNTFHKLLKGDIKPQIKSPDHAELSKLVSSKVNFNAYVPKIDDYNLVGALYNDYLGQQLVHLVYSSGDEMIYIYETHFDDICRQKLELPEPVHTEIITNKFYMCDQIDENNCTLYIWYKGNILCASVSNMPKSKLYNTLAALK